MEARAQLCDEQPPRVIVIQEPGRGLRVVFEKPTLTDQDVIGIVGFEPTEIGGAKAVRALLYEPRPLHRPFDRDAGLVLKLSFAHLRGEYRLSEVEIPEQFNAFLPPSLPDAAVKVACKAQVVVVPPSTAFDLSDLARTKLPTRDALRELLGPPTAVTPLQNEISYEFCLAPCGSRSSRVASLRCEFGIGGDLQRAQARYFRYSAMVDLISYKPTAAIELHQVFWEQPE
jgi:hypothetical protein